MGIKIIDDMDKSLSKIILAFFIFIGIGGGIVNAQNFTVTGQILDENELPLKYVTVFLSQDSVPLYVQPSNATGKFTFSNVKPGQYVFNCSFLGYHDFKSDIIVDKDVVVQAVKLSVNVIEIGSIEVVGSLPVIRREEDRFIVDMSKSVVIKNKNGLQALNYLPGVIIRRNNNITLNGKEQVGIMLNGKRINMQGQNLSKFLEGLRGEDIDRVEIISNPGAQFGASGQGGILSIHLKKSTNQGISGNVFGGMSQGHYADYNGGASLNYNYNKLSLYGSFNYASRNDYITSHSILEYPLDNVCQITDDVDRREGNNYNFRGGAQYAINKKHSLSFQIMGTISDDDNKDRSQTWLTSPTADSTTYTSNRGKPTYNNISYSLNYTYIIRPGNTLAIMSDVRSVKNDRDIYYMEKSDNSYMLERNQTGTNDFLIYSGQVDYKHPFKDKYTFSTGVKVSVIDTDIDENLKEKNQSVWVENPIYTSRYSYDEQLVAGYVNLAMNGRKMEGRIGLRAEYDISESDEMPKNKEFELFPSGFLRYKLGSDFSFSLSYSRRINRPPFRSKLPYNYFISSYSINVGNPNLKSSISNSFVFDVGYKSNFLSFGYDDIKNTIYLVSQYDKDSGISYASNRNVRNGKIFNISLTLPFKITKWWSSFNNLVYRHKQYDDARYSLRSRNNMFMMRSGNSFTLPAGVTFEVNAAYMSSPMAGPMVKEKGGFMVDMGMSKDFFKNKLSVTITMDDVTGFMNKYETETSYNNFIKNTREFSNSRKLSLSLTYRFKSGKEVKAKTNQLSGSQESRRISE